MNNNPRTNKFTIVDRQYKLRQLIAKANQTNEQVPKKYHWIEVICPEKKEAA